MTSIINHPVGGLDSDPADATLCADPAGGYHRRPDDPPHSGGSFFIRDPGDQRRQEARTRRNRGLSGRSPGVFACAKGRVQSGLASIEPPSVGSAGQCPPRADWRPTRRFIGSTAPSRAGSESGDPAARPTAGSTAERRALRSSSLGSRTRPDLGDRWRGRLLSNRERFGRKVASNQWSWVVHHHL
jgi:hypothetical protein